MGSTATYTGKILISGRPDDLIERDGRVYYRGRKVRDHRWEQLPSASAYHAQRLAETGDPIQAMIETSFAILDGLVSDESPVVAHSNVVQFTREYARSEAL